MALETGTLPADLVVTNPTASDPVSQADDHMRLIKTAVKNAAAGPAFSAYAASSQSVVTATETKVTLGTEDFDTASCFSSSRFTPNVAGYYQLNCLLHCLATSGVAYYVAIYKNGALLTQGQLLLIAANNNNQAVTLSSLVQMNGTTDYVEMYGFVSGTSPTFYTSGASTSRFSGFLARLL